MALNSCPPDKWTKTGRNVLFEIKSFKADAIRRAPMRTGFGNLPAAISRHIVAVEIGICVRTLAFNTSRR
jgi:hypothetical protein